uniref:Ycf37 n=1 Tax=Eucheuma denticulatum TaxID=305493 RepID=A0A8E7PGK6_9FLOR|nr:hypothetical protein [Eucheuma denticulatum]
MLKLYLITLNCFLAIICFLITPEIYKIFNYYSFTSKTSPYNQINFQKAINLSKIYINYKEWLLCIFTLEKYIQNKRIVVSKTYNILGFCYYSIKNYHFAEYYYGKAIDKEPNNTMFLSNLARIYMLNKQYKKAREIYKNIITIDKNNTKAKKQLLIINKLI